MERRIKPLFVAAQLVIALSVPTLSIAATTATVTAANEAAIRDDGLGVELRFDKQGVLLSVKSTYSHPVEFPDRRGIAKAYIIAEEKAKANIARYMNQVTTSSRFVTEVDESLSKATRSKSNSGENWTKDNTRNVTESLKEITTSSASAILRGVRMIEQSYDEKKEEVKVVVGINKESQMGAEQLRKGLADPGGNPSGSQAPPNQGSFPSIGSEQRRSKDADKF